MSCSEMSGRVGDPGEAGAVEAALPGEIAAQVLELEAGVVDRDRGSKARGRE